jgi:hypothetical protein
MEPVSPKPFARACAAFASLEYFTSVNEIGRIKGDCALPLLRYITSVHTAVPISTLILAQSPYPGEIQPCVGSAFCFDRTAAVDTPPTVEVLANDLFVTHGLEHEETIEWFANGWKYLGDGILLLDSYIATTYRSRYANPSPDATREFEIITKYIVELIRLSALCGQAAVNIIAFGNAAKEVVEEVVMGIASEEIQVNIIRSCHPMHVKYRAQENNIDLRTCTLDNRDLSGTLYELIMSTKRSTREESGATQQPSTLIDNEIGDELGEVMGNLGDVSGEAADNLDDIISIVREGDDMVPRGRLIELLNPIADVLTRVGVNATIAVAMDTGLLPAAPSSKPKSKVSLLAVRSRGVPVEFAPPSDDEYPASDDEDAASPSLPFLAAEAKQTAGPRPKVSLPAVRSRGVPVVFAPPSEDEDEAE